MKKTKRLLTLSAVLFLLGGGLVGCGGNNNPDPTPVDPDPTPTADKVEINFWHTFGQTIVDNLEVQLDKFVKLIKANEKVDVEINLVPCSNYTTINEQISKGLTTGNIPTLAVAYPDHVADYIKAEGSEPGKFMVNLDPYMTNSTYGFGKNAYLGDAEGDSIDDFIQSYVESGQGYVREGTYSFPYMKSTEAMLYNYDAVETILKHYPGRDFKSKSEILSYMNNLDWEEFMKLCDLTWKYKGEVNPDLVYPAFYDSDANLFISQLYQAGVGYSSIINGSGHIDFATGEDRTKAEKIVTDLRQNFVDHLFTTRGAYNGEYGSDSFKNVETVFTIGSTGGSGYSLTSDFTIEACKVPSLVKNNALYVSQGPDLCIFRNPKLSDQVNQTRAIYAWKLIKYLTNAENNCKICLHGSEGYLPVRESAFADDLYLEFLDSGITQVKIANVVTDEIDGAYLNTPCFPGSAALRTESGGIITQSLTAGDASSISGIFDTAIENATLKMD